jgi:peptide methionine sulfoxide reductase msrA/msrB
MASTFLIATFAGGCFWCLEPPFDAIKGVDSTFPGYTGGKSKNPTYEDVSSGTTGHYEAMELRYDPKLVSYEKLLETYWAQIDPTDAGGQFADRGSQYLTAIFYHDAEQKRLAEASKKALESSGKFKKPIATLILPAGDFWPAEDVHQDYYKKNPTHYNAYKKGSGRADFIEKNWNGTRDGTRERPAAPKKGGTEPK